MDDESPHQKKGLTMDRPQQSDDSGPGSQGNQVNNRKRPREDDELEETRPDYDVRVTPEFLEKFNEKYHGGRRPPSPSVLPEEFLCIHCNKMVKREENKTPWACWKHEGVLRKSSKMIMKAPRFKAGEYEMIDDDDDDDDGVMRWTCCGRREGEAPPKDCWNSTFSRGDPKLREGVLNPPKPNCPPTYHEPEKNAAGCPGWLICIDGKISKYTWPVNC